MKAVDFVFEEDDHISIIELARPAHPDMTQE